MKATIASLTGLLALSTWALLATPAGAAQITIDLLDANFDNATLGAGTTGTPATQALLQEGTAIGTWTVTSQGSAEFLRNTASAGDVVFKPDQGSPDFTLRTNGTGRLGATTVSFEFALRRFNPGTQDRDPFITLFDDSDNELLTLTSAATGGPDQRKLGIVSGGSPVYAGNVDDVNRLTADSDTDFSGLDLISVALGETSFSVTLNGTELFTGEPYETPGAVGFGGIRFFGDSPAGYYVDNVLATSVIPEPGTGLLFGVAGMALVRLRRRGR